MKSIYIFTYLAYSFCKYTPVQTSYNFKISHVENKQNEIRRWIKMGKDNLVFVPCFEIRGALMFWPPF